MSRLVVDVREIEFKCTEGKVNTKGSFIEGQFDGVQCACCSIPVVVGRDRALRMLREEFEHFKDKKLQDGVTGTLREAGVEAMTSSMPELARPEWEFSVVENEYWIGVLTHI